MKKHWINGIVGLASLTLLMACDQIGDEQDSPEEETEEVAEEPDVPDDLETNWAEYIQEAEEELESYTADLYLDVNASIGPDVLTDGQEDWLTFRVIGDFEEGHFTSEDEEGTNQEFYFNGSDAYVIENGEWVHYPDQGDEVTFDADYATLIDSLVEIEDLLEAEVTDGELRLSYEGNDREVWDAFEEEFSLSIDGIDEENVEKEIEATFDEETQYLHDLTLDISGSQGENDVELGSVSIYIEVEVSEHDEVDLSDIEEEVTQEAE